MMCVAVGFINTPPSSVWAALFAFTFPSNLETPAFHTEHKLTTPTCCWSPTRAHTHTHIQTQVRAHTHTHTHTHSHKAWCYLMCHDLQYMIHTETQIVTLYCLSCLNGHEMYRSSLFFHCLALIQLQCHCMSRNIQSHHDRVADKVPDK